MEATKPETVICHNKRDKAKGDEEICYKIIPDSNCEDNFEIESSSSSDGFMMPVHEEYKLQKARSDYILNVNAIIKKTLEELEAARVNDLQKCAQRESFLEKSEQLVGSLKNNCSEVCERINKFFVESRSQLEVLNNDCDSMNQKSDDITNELSEMLNFIKE